jgi:GNAT superfamily N-acetyltransferase
VLRDTATIRCRTAAASDWSAIWPIWHRVVSAGDTYMWAPDTDEPTARELWMRPAPAVQFVAEAASGGVATGAHRIVGTAALAPAQPGLGDHVANAGFMVDPAHAGAGIGRQLAEHVLDEARRLGYSAMQFNAVVETNTRAVALWHALGFVIVGTVPAAFRHRRQGPVGVHIMHRRL